MSPDTVSLLIPNRPIRPLPKRRLRERLSPEVADSIRYPPSTLGNTPLFFYPQPNLKNQGTLLGIEPPSLVDHARRHEPMAGLPQGRSGVAQAEEVDPGLGWRGQLGAPISPKTSGRSFRPPQRFNPTQMTANLRTPPSVTSSADGYESFENTNNKKKRKIPTVGDAVHGGTHNLNNEISSLTISTQTHQTTTESFVGDQPQHGSPRHLNHHPYAINYNQDLSGSGRGRLSRSGNARSPLRSLPDGNAIWTGRSKGVQPSLPSGHGNSSIISNAIANATKLPLQGQENVSLLLQRSTASRTMPASTQFTFTCDSQAYGAVQWPGHSSRHDLVPRTTPGLALATGSVAGPQDGSSKASSRRSANLHTKTRRRLEKELFGAARSRRRLATENYYHNPPRPEDVWICEFCEYERIFGEPPRILIRDYEIKDRRHRREEADRKRLLEKAKSKSRKGKKNLKTASRGSNVANAGSDHLQDERLENHPTPADLGHNHSTQSEGDYEDVDDEDDDYEDSARQRENGIEEMRHEDSLFADAKT